MQLINQLCEFSDEVLITDTGSTDGFLLKKNLKTLPKKVVIKHFEWINDFSAARNFSMKDATGDLIFWCDGDDVLSDKLIESINEIKTKGLDELPNVISVNYAYYPDLIIQRCNIFKRKQEWKWEGRIHEYLPWCIEQYQMIFDKDCIIYHQHMEDKPDAKKRFSRNLDIYHSIDSSLQEINGRDMFLYARELLNSEYFIPSYLCVLNAH